MYYLFQFLQIKRRMLKIGLKCKSGRVISDILKITNPLALEGFLVTVNIEKSFDSDNHCFSLQILRKFGFC